ncbi:uncharacterized protein [Periplaneta americana]|uniref:uncharacterized protein n=1 Tax=Periplaneta americana TaxID=6978 RepID=UPI0037E7CB06
MSETPEVNAITEGNASEVDDLLSSPAEEMSEFREPTLPEGSNSNNRSRRNSEAVELISENDIEAETSEDIDPNADVELIHPYNSGNGDSSTDGNGEYYCVCDERSCTIIRRNDK